MKLTLISLCLKNQRDDGLLHIHTTYTHTHTRHETASEARDEVRKLLWKKRIEVRKKKGKKKEKRERKKRPSKTKKT